MKEKKKDTDGGQRKLAIQRVGRHGSVPWTHKKTKKTKGEKWERKNNK